MKGKEYTESRIEVQTYLDRLKYALQNGARIQLQLDRKVDNERDIKFTNRFTIYDLFKNEDPIAAIKRELGSLTVKNYLRTVKDEHRPYRSDMREFGKTYNESKEIYLKIRVELLSTSIQTMDNIVFIMSFHYTTVPFSKLVFPYC